jgi:predicted RNA binding protein YcfA (HicA-like mRNA interferase family)
MPKKVRELKSLLQKAGFTYLPGRGKGSHTMWYHPMISEPIVISGKDGSDARRYQEKEVMEALTELERLEEEAEE